mmetsp:Transcript_11857/g.25057  ORF Transcript_11857/g.25057 Transcript_11857/m.25057 type:complete len:84 (-) Transcript_11857:830-1081(-)
MTIDGIKWMIKLAIVFTSWNKNATNGSTIAAMKTGPQNIPKHAKNKFFRTSRGMKSTVKQLSKKINVTMIATPNAFMTQQKSK